MSAVLIAAIVSLAAVGRMIEFISYQGLTGADGVQVILRRSANVRYRKGIYVKSTIELREKIEALPDTPVGKFQAEIYSRQIDVLRWKFMSEYEARWHSSAAMARFITNWYGHRLCKFHPPVMIDLQSDEKDGGLCRIYYG